MAEDVLRVTAQPNEEADAIKYYTNFGWKLTQRQEILSQTEKVDGAIAFTYRGLTMGDVKTHTETTHFISMIFERDVSDPDLKRLQELQNDYEKRTDGQAALDKAVKNADRDHNAKIGGLEGTLKDMANVKRNMIVMIVALVIAAASIAVYEILTVGKTDPSPAYITFDIIGLVALVVGIVFLVKFIRGKKNTGKDEQIHQQIKELEGQDATAIAQQKADENKQAFQNDLKEADEINARLAKQKKGIAVPENAQANSADALKKYKELLDAGAITQEEYDKKKADLLK
jgi:hypothetical protein